jgi:hypothetical protein
MFNLSLIIKKIVNLIVKYAICVLGFQNHLLHIPTHKIITFFNKTNFLLDIFIKSPFFL